MIKFIIAMGIGFSPGSVKWIPTMGFLPSVAPVPEPGNGGQNHRMVGGVGVGT